MAKRSKIRSSLFMIASLGRKLPPDWTQRVQNWDAAFATWLGAQPAGRRIGCRDAWRGLVTAAGCLPWELTEARLEAHLAMLAASGDDGPQQADLALEAFYAFFRYCLDRSVDADWSEDFNPAEAAWRRRERQRSAPSPPQGERGASPPEEDESTSGLEAGGLEASRQAAQAPVPQAADAAGLPSLPEAVEQMLKAEVSGARAELEGLRCIARQLLDLQQLPGLSDRRMGGLIEAYTLAVSRLACLLERPHPPRSAVELMRPDASVDDAVWAEEMLKLLDRAAADFGFAPVSVEVRAEVQATQPENSLEVEVAGVRVGMRKLRRVADEAWRRRQVEELIHLAELYGTACTRLVRLLRGGHSEGYRLAAYLRAQIDLAIENTVKDWPIVKKFRALECGEQWTPEEQSADVADDADFIS